MTNYVQVNIAGPKFPWEKIQNTFTDDTNIYSVTNVINYVLYIHKSYNWNRNERGKKKNNWRIILNMRESASE